MGATSVAFISLIVVTGISIDCVVSVLSLVEDVSVETSAEVSEGDSVEFVTFVVIDAGDFEREGFF